ncbi:MAG: hypothetical protein ACKVS5_13605 [Parvularculaceae bacterium]
MSNAAKEKLHAFERMLILKSRTMRNGGALAAVSGLCVMLNELGSETIVQTNPTVSSAFAQASADLAGAAAALQAGAHEAAIGIYANLVTSIPAMHAAIAAAVPADIRGHDPTPPEPLALAVQRALAILGL